MSDRYTHGHHASVLRSHTWRTAENSAGYLLAHLRESMSLLDVGCGPGTLTCDLATRVRNVVGIEPVSDILLAATATSVERGVENVEFVVGDVYELQFENDSFDVAHAHQVLQHLSDPVAAITEMLRVTKPGGIVAVRDADYHAMSWYPELPELDRWMDMYQAVARANGAEPDAARHLLSWAADAGVARERIHASVDTWLFYTPEERAWWGSLWAERSVRSAFGEQAREYGLAAESDQESIANAWNSWSAHPSAWFLVPNGELLITA